MRLFPIILAATLAAAPALAGEDMIHKVSPHDVATTTDRLAAAVEGGGAKVIARVDHAKAAEGAGLELRPTTLLIFGNPEMGTKLMQAGQTAGLDLPMRVLVYQTEGGEVHVVYHDPEEVAEMHGIDDDLEVVEKMTGALDKLTDNAIAEE